MEAPASLKDIRCNAAGDPLRRLVEGVPRQMGIARRRLDVAVAEQLPDHGVARTLAERR